MSRMQLNKAYLRLNISEYKSTIQDTLIPLFDDYDGEYLTTLTPETKFTIEKRYSPFTGKFLGFNICADGILLETKSTKKKAEKYLKRLNGGSPC